MSDETRPLPPTGPPRSFMTCPDATYHEKREADRRYIVELKEWAPRIDAWAAEAERSQERDADERERLAAEVKRLKQSVEQWRGHYQLEANENTAIREVLGVDLHEPDASVTATEVTRVLDRARLLQRQAERQCENMRQHWLDAEHELKRADSDHALLLANYETWREAAHRLRGDLVAAGDGLPVLVCPNCGEPTVDYDGFGLVACPRDPQCYCRHLAYTDGSCDVCGKADEDDGNEV